MIGIVVIGRNEGARLVRCLASLPSSDAYIVYVDSGSTDGSIAAAEARGAHVVPLDMSLPFNAARARNAGIDALAASGLTFDLVQFLDGDCALDPAWIGRATDFLEQHPEVAVACGRRREIHPDRTIYNRACDLEWNTPIGEAEACGGDALMRYAAISSVGGYDGTLVAGEEPELCSRLRAAGWKIWRMDAEMTMHDAAISAFGQWWTRAVRGGFAYAQTSAVSAGRPERPMRLSFLRAIFWGGVFPVAAIASALLHPLLVAFGVAVYAARIVRVRQRLTLTAREAWACASLTVLGQFAEMQGIVRYWWRRFRRAPNQAILYK